MEEKKINVNVLMSLIAFLLSALLGFWVYSVAKEDDNSVIAGVISTICFVATIVPLMGFNYFTTRLGVSIRVLSLLTFIVFVIVNFIYAGNSVTVPSYFITNGLILLIYFALFYKMCSINDV